jgi:menaquinone-9 beta-reductase
VPAATDLFVIGGGPAGLAAAIAARQQGFRVIVADGATPPIDKPCGEALMPDAIKGLRALGIAMPADESAPVRGVRFISGELSAEANFPAGSHALSVRRTTLHRLMIERADAVGAELLWNSSINSISRNEVQFAKRSVHARWIIGADGVNSRVRRWAKLNAHSRSPLRYAFRRHYRVQPWTDRMEIYWGKKSQAYAIRVGRDQMTIAVASREQGHKLDKSLSQFPQLNARLRGAEVSSSERGSVIANRKLRHVYRGNVALIGDASGTVDAITGEGLGLAFNQALLLAQCLKSGQLAAYQFAHRRLMMRPSFMARLMLTLDGRPRLQRRVLRVFNNRAELFHKLLAFHIGNLSPSDLAFNGITLGWGLLTA